MHRLDTLLGRFKRREHDKGKQIAPRFRVGAFLIHNFNRVINILCFIVIVCLYYVDDHEGRPFCMEAFACVLFRDVLESVQADRGEFVPVAEKPVFILLT